MAAAAVPLIPASKRPLTVISESVATDNSNFKKLIENDLNTSTNQAPAVNNSTPSSSSSNSKETKVNHHYSNQIITYCYYSPIISFIVHNKA